MSQAPLPFVYDSSDEEDSFLWPSSQTFRATDKSTTEEAELKYYTSPRHRRPSYLDKIRDRPERSDWVHDKQHRHAFKRISPAATSELEKLPKLSKTASAEWARRNHVLIFLVLFAFLAALYNIVCNWTIVPSTTKELPTFSALNLLYDRDREKRFHANRTGIFHESDHNYFRDSSREKTQSRLNSSSENNYETKQKGKEQTSEGIGLYSEDTNVAPSSSVVKVKIYHPRTTQLDSSKIKIPGQGRTLQQYPATYSDVTQIYSKISSNDEIGIMVLQNMKKNIFPDSQLDPPGDCAPISKWQTQFYPTCNRFHEIDVESNLNLHDMDLFGTKGYWRHAWKLTEKSSNVVSEEASDSVVLKTLRYEHDYEEDYFETNRIDAVAMERATSSPNVIDIYGFCGMAAITEFATGQFKPHVDVSNSIEKLKIARDVANGLAAIHGIDAATGNVTLVHNDINPSNVVVNDSLAKLNDFNIGVLMTWNQRENRQCRFLNRFQNSQWRAPEEQMIGGVMSDEPLTEKVDIYALGNIFYRMIVGHDPWKEYKGTDGRISHENQLRIAELKRLEGTLPRIPRKIRKTKEKPIAAIRDVMHECFQFKPEDRPNAAQVATKLSIAYESLK